MESKNKYSPWARDHPLDIAALGLDDLEVAAVARFDFLHKSVRLGMEPEVSMVAKRKFSPMDVAMWIIATPVYWKLVLSTRPAGKGLAGPAQKILGGHLLQG